MNRKDYENPLSRQVLSIPSLADEQLESCFDKKKLHSLISVPEIFDVRKIVLTGCGDSISAAMSVQDKIMEFAGVFGCDAYEAVEWSRFHTVADIGIGEPNSPLVVGISAGGGTARVAEVLQKAKEIGAISMLITNRKDTRCSNTADKVYYLDTPKRENDSPGMRTYFASQLGLLALGVRLGKVRNVLGPTAEEDYKKKISDYIHLYDEKMEEYADQMFELAKKWKDLKKYDFIGNGPQLASALFTSQKYYECYGLVTNVDDAEDWCHIDYFLKNPEEIGTVIFANKYDKYFSRVKETVNSAVSIGRPTLVISNADKSEFVEGAEVLVLPDGGEDSLWLQPLMEELPASLLASYCTVLANVRFFREMNALTGEFEGDGKYFNQDIMTLSTSKIEIHK